MIHTPTRRKFLTLSAAATASVLLSRKAFADPMGLPAGIQLYAVRDELKADTPGTLKKLHEIGYREVETAGFGKYSAKEFASMAKDAGLTIPSAHLQLGVADLTSAFDDAKALGATYATSSSLAAKPAEMLQPDDFKKLAAQVNGIAAKAKSAGLKYAYHNHNYEFAKMPDNTYGYDILLKETDPKLVWFEADCGWFSVAGANPADYFRKHPGRFRMLHVKDFRPITKPVTSLGVGRPDGMELGRGFVNYKPIFAAGKAAGIQHAFAEQEGPYTHPQLESAKIDYDFLHTFS